MVLALSYSKLAFNFLGYLKKIFVIFLEQHDWVASPPIRGSGYIKLKKKWCIFLNHCWIAVLWLPSTFHRRSFKGVTYFICLLTAAQVSVSLALFFSFFLSFFSFFVLFLFFLILEGEIAPEALLGLFVELQHKTPQSPQRLTLLQSSAVFELKFPTVCWHWWVVS